MVSIFPSPFPNPFLRDVTSNSVPSFVLWIGIVISLIALTGVLSEQVVVNEDTIKVTYPSWVPSFFCKGWSLSWLEIKDLRLRTTGQGDSFTILFFVMLKQRIYYRCESLDFPVW